MANEDALFQLVVHGILQRGDSVRAMATGLWSYPPVGIGRSWMLPPDGVANVLALLGNQSLTLARMNHWGSLDHRQLVMPPHAIHFSDIRYISAEENYGIEYWLELRDPDDNGRVYRTRLRFMDGNEDGARLAALLIASAVDAGADFEDSSASAVIDEDGR